MATTVLIEADHRTGPHSTIGSTGRPAFAVTTAIVTQAKSVNEPDPPSEANSDHRSAPNEPKTCLQSWESRQSTSFVSRPAARTKVKVE